MDIRQTAEAMGIELNEFLALVEMLIVANRRDVSSLKTALQENRPEEAADTAHHIKGAAINLALDDIADPALQIEKACKSGDIELGRSRFSALEDACDDLERLYTESVGTDA